MFLFTLTISHQRAKFFFESRGVFENLFLKNFDPEHPRTSYTAYTIPDVLDEIDYIATRVGVVCMLMGTGTGYGVHDDIIVHHSLLSPANDDIIVISPVTDLLIT